MFTIAGTPYTLSEVANLIKNDDSAVWHPKYIYYLPKIENSGSTSFPNLTTLIMNLASYCVKENSLDAIQLQRTRGTAPSGNVAIRKGVIDRSKVNEADRIAIAHLMAGNEVGNGISNKSRHTTDPETGKPKAYNVSVKEYYVNGADGRRATKRTEGTKVTYYYSDSHTNNTYQYQLLL
ncbi:hypothetical protein SAMN05518865_10890 [Duganella sp. CF458]|uniref:hypothetical protein n=1 Tax=Duganella sp. CF458 TaxID=1884368 RepID=UPI0008E83A86|nr:hypothetical protein [Duganella sp. CF458]SFG09184.1 hypothetical protein SAMN05518865_10890 [Duganella sp. CF458]